MKCDELFVYCKTTCDPQGLYYDKSEVDAAIAELKAKLAEKDKEITRLESACRAFATERDANQDAIYELRKEIESLKASHYTEMVDAGMRERRLRRALWIARAERANDNYRLFYFSDTFGEPLNIKGYSAPEKGATKMRDSAEWKKFFLKVERKCLKKAEEYK